MRLQCAGCTRGSNSPIETFPEVALTIPAAILAVTAAACGEVQTTATCSPARTSTSSGPTRSSPVPNDAPRIRSTKLKAVRFAPHGQTQLRAIQCRSSCQAVRDPHAHGNGGRVVLQIHCLRKGCDVGRER